MKGVLFAYVLGRISIWPKVFQGADVRSHNDTQDEYMSEFRSVHQSTLPNSFPRRVGVRFCAALAVAGFASVHVQAAVIYTQDFESSTPASEYASGEFDPAGPAFSQNVKEQKKWFIQVVDTNTTANLSPSGPPQVFEGSNSLKIDSNATASPPPGPSTPIYQIWPTTSEFIPGPPQSSVTFSFYGVPAAAANVVSPRLLEVWSAEGGSANPPVTYGGPFSYAIRFDQDGRILYDRGGWQDSGLTVTYGQWNTCTITCDASVSPDWVTMTLNGVFHDNNGQGFSANDDLATIGRYQFAGQLGSGVGAGIFIDDITIVDTAPGPPGPDLSGIQVANAAAFSFVSLNGTDYLLQTAKTPSKPFWRNTGCTIHGNGSPMIVTDPEGIDPGSVYRVIEK